MPHSAWCFWGVGKYGLSGRGGRVEACVLYWGVAKDGGDAEEFESGVVGGQQDGKDILFKGRSISLWSGFWLYAALEESSVVAFPGYSAEVASRTAERGGCAGVDGRTGVQEMGGSGAYIVSRIAIQPERDLLHCHRDEVYGTFLRNIGVLGTNGTESTFFL